jgi:hypothetical protein
MKLINLTGHPLILGDDHHQVRFPSRGRSRIEASYDVDGYVEVVGDDGDFVTVPLLVTRDGTVTSLPEPIPDRLYVVSGLVAGQVRRKDVVSPARLHRVNGKVEYARALMAYDDQ